MAWRQFLVVPRIIPVDDLKVASDAATAVVPLVLGPTSRASGSLALGLFLNSSNPLPIRNYFQVSTIKSSMLFLVSVGRNFRQLAPGAQPTPKMIPPQLL